MDTEVTDTDNLDLLQLCQNFCQKYELLIVKKSDISISVTSMIFWQLREIFKKVWYFSMFMHTDCCGRIDIFKETCGQVCGVNHLLYDR